MDVQGGEELRKAARCPLCYSMVAARELKLVQVLPIHVPQVRCSVPACLYLYACVSKPHIAAEQAVHVTKSGDLQPVTCSVVVMSFHH